MAAFIAMMLKNQAGAQVPDFEFKGFRTSSASPSEYRPCGTPRESGTSECRAYMSVDHMGYPVSHAQVHPLDSSVLRMWVYKEESIP